MSTGSGWVGGVQVGSSLFHNMCMDTHLHGNMSNEAITLCLFYR